MTRENWSSHSCSRYQQRRWSREACLISVFFFQVVLSPFLRMNDNNLLTLYVLYCLTVLDMHVDLISLEDTGSVCFFTGKYWFQGTPLLCLRSARKWLAGRCPIQVGILSPGPWVNWSLLLFLLALFVRQRKTICLLLEWLTSESCSLFWKFMNAVQFLHGTTAPVGCCGLKVTCLISSNPENNFTQKVENGMLRAQSMLALAVSVKHISELFQPHPLWELLLITRRTRRKDMEERIKGRRQKEGRPSQTHFFLHPEVFAVPQGWWMQRSAHRPMWGLQNGRFLVCPFLCSFLKERRGWVTHQNQTPSSTSLQGKRRGDCRFYAICRRADYVNNWNVTATSLWKMIAMSPLRLDFTINFSVTGLGSQP